MDLSQFEGSGLKAEDLIPPDANELHKEKLEQQRRSREQATLEEQIERVDQVLSEEKRPGPTMLGVRLALEMALEIRDSIPLGTQSSKLIHSWQQVHSSASIEESIAIARTFLTKPAELAAAMRQRLFNGRA